MFMKTESNRPVLVFNHAEVEGRLVSAPPLKTRRLSNASPHDELLTLNRQERQKNR